MADALYYVLFIGMVALAVYRKRDMVTATLAGALAVSVAAPSFRHMPELLAWLAVIEGVTCSMMRVAWGRTRSKRAWAVGFIGLAKSILIVAQAGNFLHMSFLAFIILLNCGFLMQVIVAGGFADAVGAWLDRAWRRFFPRAAFMLRDDRYSPEKGSPPKVTGK